MLEKNEHMNDKTTQLTLQIFSDVSSNGCSIYLISILHLHAVDNLEEYFRVCSANTCAKRALRFEYLMKHPPKKHIVDTIIRVSPITSIAVNR